MSMDEKVLEMLAKLIEGQSEIKAQMARMEADFCNKIGALFDGHKTEQETSEKILEKLQIIETKVGDLQLETAHVRRVK